MMRWRQSIAYVPTIKKKPPMGKQMVRKRKRFERNSA